MKNKRSKLQIYFDVISAIMTEKQDNEEVSKTRLQHKSNTSYEQLLNMLMDFNESVRFAAVSDASGNLLWNSQRDGVSNIVPIEKTKATMSRSRSEWDDYASSANTIGDGLYSITSYAKIKRITIPLSDGNMLFVSVNNKPMKNAKNTSYGHLVEMGEILSIVEFVESQNF